MLANNIPMVSDDDCCVPERVPMSLISLQDGAHNDHAIKGNNNNNDKPLILGPTTSKVEIP